MFLRATLVVILLDIGVFRSCNFLPSPCILFTFSSMQSSGKPAVHASIYVRPPPLPPNPAVCNSHRPIRNSTYTRPTKGGCPRRQAPNVAPAAGAGGSRHHGRGFPARIARSRQCRGGTEGWLLFIFTCLYYFLAAYMVDTLSVHLTP